MSTRKVLELLGAQSSDSRCRSMDPCIFPFATDFTGGSAWLLNHPRQSLNKPQWSHRRGTDSSRTDFTACGHHCLQYRTLEWSFDRQLPIRATKFHLKCSGSIESQRREPLKSFLMPRVATQLLSSRSIRWFSPIVSQSKVHTTLHLPQSMQKVG